MDFSLLCAVDDVRSAVEVLTADEWPLNTFMAWFKRLYIKTVEEDIISGIYARMLTVISKYSSICWQNGWISGVLARYIIIV